MRRCQASTIRLAGTDVGQCRIEKPNSEDLEPCAGGVGRATILPEDRSRQDAELAATLSRTDRIEESQARVRLHEAETRCGNAGAEDR